VSVDEEVDFFFECFFGVVVVSVWLVVLDDCCVVDGEVACANITAALRSEEIKNFFI
jgi:hypothetical protein